MTRHPSVDVGIKNRQLLALAVNDYAQARDPRFAWMKIENDLRL